MLQYIYLHKYILVNWVYFYREPSLWGTTLDRRLSIIGPYIRLISRIVDIPGYVRVVLTLS
jgi:hypothetical protein